jgi:hypothetical protein
MNVIPGHKFSGFLSARPADERTCWNENHPGRMLFA